MSHTGEEKEEEKKRKKENKCEITNYEYILDAA
jgi:hypothetical protein